MTNQFMDEGAKQYLYKFCHKNHWRVAAWMDLDDLIQDGYECYYYTLNRYPKAEKVEHVMSLFKLVLRSKIEDLVRANTKQVDDARSDLVEVFESPMMIIPDFSNLHALLLKAPKTIKDALELMLDNQAREELCKPFERYENGRRETLNDRFCRLLGLDSKIDVVGDIRTYFASA